MATVEHTSDSEIDDPKKITDAASCLDYLKRREVFLYKMMNDPSHKAMLYFLEVLMNSEAPLTVEQLAARFTHKSFSPEMREACGGGSAGGLREFLLRYPSLFHVRSNDQVDSVAIELPGMEGLYDGLNDSDLCLGPPSVSSTNSANRGVKSDSTNGTSGPLPITEQYRHGRFRPVPKSHDLMNRAKMKSTSSLSLESTPSNASSSSESMSSFTRSHGNDRTDIPGKKTSNNELFGTRGSDASLLSWTNKRGIYQPPPLRERNGTQCENCKTKPNCCDQMNNCVSTNNGTMTNNSEKNNNSCMFCSLYELVCHHHCPVAHNHHHHPHHHLQHPHQNHHHHHGETHCLCPSAHVNSTSHFCTCCMVQPSSCNNHTTKPSTLSTTTTISTNVCALPPMEKLVIETEAVRFFQQRLLKREERWVPIKSLAGHLSQATPEVRAVVGPQLDFRSFLIKHPHVFEIQGELVSVKDPFGNFFPTTRRARERFAPLHQSFSSSNLTSLGGGFGPALGNSMLTRGGPVERAARPKSMVLSGSGSLLPSPFTSPLIQPNGRRLMENRRSIHFVDSSITKPQVNGTNEMRYLVNSATDLNNTEGYIKRSSSFAKTTSEATTPLTPVPVSRPSDGDTESVAQSTWPCSTKTSSGGGLSISMSANEYRAIMFLRKVLEKRGGGPNQEGLTLSELMLILTTKAPDSVQPTIGWTKVELEEFISQQPIFFEMILAPINRRDIPDVENSTRESSQKRVRNKRLEKMINIVITGSKLPESNVRTMTNRSGRIFHVAKLWGIIDLGKHEHVFFDKSIFKHVDDLQKYFKVDELLYFNAILASKESRAKWRATQVWKECDREFVETLNGPIPRVSSGILSDESHSFELSSVSKAIHRNAVRRHSSTPKPLPCMHPIENEDTEADEEIEDIEVDPTSHTRSSNPGLVNLADSDCEFALNGDEEIDDEEPFISELARQEGLHLANDIKFIKDDESQTHSQEKGVSSTHPDFPIIDQKRRVSQQDTRSYQSTKLQTDSFSLISEAEMERRNNFVSSSTEHTPSDCIFPRLTNMCTFPKDDNATSTSSTASSAISIAVQTVSTGEIMATQLYHDASKEPCQSG